MRVCGEDMISPYMSAYVTKTSEQITNVVVRISRCRERRIDLGKGNKIVMAFF